MSKRQDFLFDSVFLVPVRRNPPRSSGNCYTRSDSAHYRRSRSHSRHYRTCRCHNRYGCRHYRSSHCHSRCSHRYWFLQAPKALLRRSRCSRIRSSHSHNCQNYRRNHCSPCCHNCRHSHCRCRIRTGVKVSPTSYSCKHPFFFLEYVMHFLLEGAYLLC